MFSTWNGTQDVGWVRYTFDQYKVPYDLIFKERVLKGNLHADYDLIVIPTQARSSKALITDIPKSKTPLAYTKTDTYKFLGDYGSSDDITGGMGTRRRHRVPEASPKTAASSSPSEPPAPSP